MAKFTIFIIIFVIYIKQQVNKQTNKNLIYNITREKYKI
jgi:hypothetical protein